MMLACFMLGLPAGGMLVIGVAFVSVWQSLSPSDFQPWFASHSHLIGRLMIPLGTGSIVVAVAALVASWCDPARRLWSQMATLTAVGGMRPDAVFLGGTDGGGW